MKGFEKLKNCFEDFILSLEDEFGKNGFVRVASNKDSVCAFQNKDFPSIFEVRFGEGIANLVYGKQILDSYFFGECIVENDCKKLASRFVGCAKKVEPQSELENKLEVPAMDSHRFFDRFTSVFPDLKSEFAIEREGYRGNFSPVKFSSLIAERVTELLRVGKEKNKLERIFKFLSGAYVNGDETVKCLVTMAIFNEISGSLERSFARTFLSSAMRKVWDASARFCKSPKKEDGKIKLFAKHFFKV
jgi:hypothetical protein